MKGMKHRDHVEIGENTDAQVASTWRAKTLFVTLSLLLAFVFYFVFTRFFDSIEDQLLKEENFTLKTQLQILEDRIDRSEIELNALIEKDDHNYRVILDAEPLSAEVRMGGSGGSEKFDRDDLTEVPNVLQDYESLAKLKSQLDVEIQSYKSLQSLLNERIRMWASRPAIQPINNKQLNQLHMRFGARMHPIFKVVKEHNGLDLSAPKGTPVYATGDGKVIRANRSGTYGKVIYINHGHGYETRYAHLSSFGVRPGESIKRGQIIGYVGSTGTSMSCHLHYEVLFNNRHLNPINFFQRDLSNKEYERLIEMAAVQNKALD
jgi:hypothetical protein